MSLSELEIRRAEKRVERHLTSSLGLPAWKAKSMSAALVKLSSDVALWHRKTLAELGR
jgi:hypothetical protein